MKVKIKSFDKVAVVVDGESTTIYGVKVERQIKTPFGFGTKTEYIWATNLPDHPIGKEYEITPIPNSKLFKISEKGGTEDEVSVNSVI